MLKFASFAILSARTAQTGHGLMKDAHRHEFLYTPRPGYLYVRSRAISSRCNDNFDEFPAEEIKQAYRTFVGKPVFVNHHNENHRRARGVIVDAALHEDVNPDGTPDTWVEVLMEVDAINFPKLARAILAGEIDRTSMGCDVAYSKCSFCGNKAVTPLDYCQHVKRNKGQRIRRKNAATGAQEDVLVREICYGLSFFENSLLVEEPADPTAFFLGVESGDDLVAQGRKTAAKAAGYGDESEWMAQGEGRVYLVDTDNRPIIYGDNASATPASFLWPREEALAAITTSFVRDPGYDLPAAQIMEPSSYRVVWANRYGRDGWWVFPRTAAKTAWTEPGTKAYDAHTELNNAVRDGKKKKPKKCSRCGKGGQINGHHSDYDKPLDVEWLCNSCHKKTHSSKTAAGRLDTPITSFGLQYDPSVTDEAWFREAQAFTGWDNLPSIPVSTSDPLWASEAMVSSSSINKVVLGGEAFRAGYDPHVVIAPDGRRVVIDGNHRAAMYRALGSPTMPMKLLDLRPQAKAHRIRSRRQGSRWPDGALRLE